MGENHFAHLPSALYGVILLAAAMAYLVLQRTIVAAEGPDSLLERALGRDRKGKLSPVVYVAGIVASFFSPAVAQAMYVIVALTWLVPDRRIERELRQRSE